MVIIPLLFFSGLHMFFHVQAIRTDSYIDICIRTYEVRVCFCKTRGRCFLFDNYFRILRPYDPACFFHLAQSDRCHSLLPALSFGRG